MIFHENHLLADDSHEISYFLFFHAFFIMPHLKFLKKQQNLNCRLPQIEGDSVIVCVPLARLVKLF